MGVGAVIEGLAVALDALTYGSPLEAAEMRVASTGLDLQTRVAELERRTEGVAFFEVAPGGLLAPAAMVVCLCALVFYIVHGATLYSKSEGEREAARVGQNPNYSSFDFEFSYNYFNSFLESAYVFDNAGVIVGLVMCSGLSLMYVLKLRSMTWTWRKVVMEHYVLKASHRIAEANVLKAVVIVRSLPVYDTGKPLGRFRDAVCRVIYANSISKMKSESEQHRILAPMVGKSGAVDWFKYAHRWYKLTLGSGGKYTGVKVVITEVIEFLVQTNAFLQLGGSDLPNYIYYGGATEAYRQHQTTIILANNDAVLVVYAVLLMLNCIGTPIIVNFAPKTWTHNFKHLVLKCFDVFLDIGYMAITFWIAIQTSESIFGPGSRHVSYVGTTFGSWFTLWFPFFSVWNSLPDAYEAAMFFHWVHAVMGEGAEFFGRNDDDVGGGEGEYEAEYEGEHKGNCEGDGKGIDGDAGGPEGCPFPAGQGRIAESGKVHPDDDVEAGPLVLMEEGADVHEENDVRVGAGMMVPNSFMRFKSLTFYSQANNEPLGLTRDGVVKGESFLLNRANEDKERGVEDIMLMNKLSRSIRTLRWLEDHEVVTPSERLATRVVSVVAIVLGVAIFVVTLVAVLSRDGHPICSDTSLREGGYNDNCKDYGGVFGTCRVQSLELTGQCETNGCPGVEPKPGDKKFIGCEVPTAKNDNFDYNDLSFTSGKVTSLEGIPCYCTSAVVNVAENYEAGGVVPEGALTRTPGLRSINLRSNLIGQTAFDEAVAKFPEGLVTLEAGGNLLTDLKAGMTRLTSLQDLAVGGSPLLRIATEFWHLPKLRKLDVSNACLSAGENKFYPDAASAYSKASCASMMTFEAPQNRLSKQGFTSFLQWIFNGKDDGCTLRKFSNLEMWKMVLQDKYDFTSYYKPMAMFDDTDVDEVDELITDVLTAGLIPFLYVGANPDLSIATALEMVAKTSEPSGRNEPLRPADGLIPWFGFGLSNQPNMTDNLAAGTAGRAHLETIATGLGGLGSGTYLALRCGDLEEIPLSASVLSSATSNQPRVWIDLSCNPLCTEANAIRTEEGQGYNEDKTVLILFDNGAGTFIGEDEPGAGSPLDASGYRALSGRVGTGLTIFCSMPVDHPACEPSDMKGYFCIKPQDWSQKTDERCEARALEVWPDESTWGTSGGAAPAEPPASPEPPADGGAPPPPPPSPPPPPV